MKVVQTYQQNFVSNTEVQNQSFNFTRVYKQNPNHKLMVTVASLSYYSTTANDEPVSFFLEGVGEFSSSSTTQQSLGDVVMNSWYLGSLGHHWDDTSKSGSSVFESPKKLVDDLTLNPFKISIQGFNSVGESSKFIVSLNIDVVEV
jgi:hypothetical protein